MVMKGYTAVMADSDDEIVPGELELTGDAAEAHVLSGKTFYSTDPRVKRTGKIPIQAGGTFLPDTTDKVAVKGGTHVSTDIIVPKFTLPAANVIKKGVKVTMYGKSVTGTFEGWVPTAQDLFYNGVFNVPMTINADTAKLANTKIQFTKDYITINTIVTINNTIDVRSYSKLIIEGNFIYKGSTNPKAMLVSNNVAIAQVAFTSTTSSLTFNIENMTSINNNTDIRFGQHSPNNYINRIRLA